MKTALSPLSEFINDFDLMAPNKTVCFKAIVYFSSNFLTIHLDTEVHIVHLDAKSMNIIYLLDPAIEKSGMPSLFEDHHEEISYLFKNCLIVKGNSPSFGNYVLTIHPTGSNCSEETLAKLHAKPFIFEQR